MYPARVLAIALTLIALGTITAPAHSSQMRAVTTSGQIHVHAQRIINRAQAPLPAETVTVHWEACPSDPIASCTGPGLTDIWWQPDHSNSNFRHELGHRADYAQDDMARDTFRRLLRDSRPWRAIGGNSPHEQYAEAWSLCAGSSWRVWEGRVHGDYAYEPTVRVHRRVCEMIGKTARRLAWPS